jgi:uncharacterized DUF497 family protein
VEFEWDEAKRFSNLRKHGVDFARVTEFEWRSATVSLDIRRQQYGELRLIASGLIADRVHIPIFTYRGSRIRVISLRKANEKEIADMKRRIRRNTPEEEAAINRGIAEDPDNPELSKADFARMRPAIEVIPDIVEDWLCRTRGKQKQPTKVLVSLRLERDVVDRLRASGRGWQSRANDMLRKAVLGS